MSAKVLKLRAKDEVQGMAPWGSAVAGVKREIQNVNNRDILPLLEKEVHGSSWYCHWKKKNLRVKLKLV